MGEEGKGKEHIWAVLVDATGGRWEWGYEQMYRPSSGEEQDVEAHRADKQLGQCNRLKASGCSWKHIWGWEHNGNESFQV